MRKSIRYAALGLFLLAGGRESRGAGQVFVTTVLDSSVAGAYSARIADLNNDGRRDLIGCAFNGNALFWLENTGAGGFVRHAMATGLNALIAIPADVDRDGDSDVVVSAWNENRVSWWENSGTGSFDEHVVTDSFTWANGVDAVDLNKDGFTDLLGTSFAAEGVRWWQNDGSQHFTQHVIVNRDSSEIAVAVDINKDGAMDVVATSWTASGGISVCTNDGAMNFAEQFLPFPWAHWVAAADLDGDGNIDIVGASYGQEVAWWKNDGGGGYTKHSITTGFNGADHVVIADLDGDGDPDIVAAAWNAGTVCWFENDGAGTFTQHNVSTALSGAIGIDVGDLDGDGDQDIVAAGFNANRIEWYRNKTNLAPLLDPASQTIDRGDTAHAALTIASANGYHGTVHLSATVAPGPATGSIGCLFSPGSINPTGTCTLAIAASPDVSLGRYVISITTADSADAFLNAAAFTLYVQGSGDVLCVGGSESMIDLVRSVWPQSDSANRLPPAVDSRYRYLVVEDSGSTADSAVIRAYLLQGGNVILIGHAVADLAGSNTLTPIAGWLGAKSHNLYSGSGMGVIATYAQPFNVPSIAVGDTFGTAPDGSSRLTGINAGAVKLAKYGTSATIIGALYNQSGTGQCLWLTCGAGFSAKSDSLIRGFLVHPVLGVESQPAVPAMPRDRPLLVQAFPNPARGRFSVLYQLATPGTVALKLYDIAGRLVRTAKLGSQGGGTHRIADPGFGRLAAGVYFIKVEAGAAGALVKVVVLR